MILSEYVRELLNILIETQKSVVNFISSIQQCLDKAKLIRRGGKTEKISKQASKRLFAIYRGYEIRRILIVDEDIQKGQSIITFFFHGELNAIMLRIKKVKEERRIMLIVEKTESVINISTVELDRRMDNFHFISFSYV